MLTGTAAYADVTSVVAEKEYELWTQSPSITCGLTSDDVRIYKALDQNLLELYPLSLIGDNYYLAICSYKMTDGGYNGKSKTTQLLKDMGEKGVVTVEGKGRGTKYIIK